MSKRLRNRKLPLADWHLWNDVTRTVKPIINPVIRSVPGADTDLLYDEMLKALGPIKSIKPIKLPKVGRKAVRPAPIHAKSYTPVQPNPRPAPPPIDKRLEPRLHRRLMRGQMPIDATLDLHGMRQHEAEIALMQFVISAYARGNRSLLVITGKGLKKMSDGQIEQRGVLRHMLPVWLRHISLSPLVAGWEVSAHGHGGEGAYYVRLKGARS